MEEGERDERLLECSGRGIGAGRRPGRRLRRDDELGDGRHVRGERNRHDVHGDDLHPCERSEQGAFAIDATGRTIAKVDVSSSPGVFSSTSGPGGKSAAWVPDAGAVPGASVVAAVTTSAALTGSNTITVTPAGTDRTTWFDPVVCSFPKGATIPSSRFTAQHKATYSAVSGTWREAVTLPGPGKVNFVHKTLAASGTPKPLIKSGGVSVGKAGQVMLTLRPTVAGAAVLSRSGAIKLNLNIEYSPTNGKPANKTISLTLRK